MLMVGDVDAHVHYPFSTFTAAFLPVPSGLLVHLAEFKESVRSFVQRLPTIFEKSATNDACLGTALSAAHSLIVSRNLYMLFLSTIVCLQASYGGRITLMTTSRPSVGTGVVESCDTTSGKGEKAVRLAPSSDHYKRFALECSQQQVSVDIFAMHNGNIDLTTLGALINNSLLHLSLIYS